MTDCPRSRILRVLLGAAYCLFACAAWTQSSMQGDFPSRSTESPAEAAPGTSSLAETESNLRRNLQSEPSSAWTLYALAEVLRRENKPTESLAIYTKAAQFQKPDAEQLRSVAMDYALLKMYNDAIHWLEIARTLDPHDSNVLYDLGRCFYTQGRFPEAEAMYLRVLEIAPKSIKAEENLGLTLDMELEPQKAEAALRTAAAWAEQEQSDEWPYLNLGAFLRAHDRAAEAVPFLEKATKRNPRNAACHEKLGRSLADSGQIAAGIDELLIAVQLDAQNPKIHFELGQTYRIAGQRDKAAAEFALSRTLYGTRSHE